MRAVITLIEEKLWLYIALAIVLVSLIVGVGTILIGNFPFWYDPARDFLMAWDNLAHPTFIGPTSGIPGIFYGPYWIWLLSIGVFLSKDPKVAMLIVLAIPYLLLLPLYLSRSLSSYKKIALTSVWGLFVATYGIEYATKPWNPYLAPILLFCLIPLLASLNVSALSRRNTYALVIAGGIGGLIANAHLSLGSGVMIGSMLYIIIAALLSGSFKGRGVWKRLINGCFALFLFGLGIGVSFIPFILFEIRHGFNQVKMLLFMITSPFPVVGVQGLSEQDILKQFPLVASRLLHISDDWVKIVFVVVTVVLIALVVEGRVRLSSFDKRILGVIVAIFITLFTIYMTSKNPVWEYHFIGMEVLLLFYILILAEKIMIVRLSILILSGMFLFGQMSSFIYHIRTGERFRDVIATKIEVVESVIKDAGESDYVVYPHSTSIYTYDYAYLFRWKNGVEVPYDPAQNTKVADTAYLIIPAVGDAAKNDFIMNKLKNTDFTLTKHWRVRDVEIQKIEKR